MDYIIELLLFIFGLPLSATLPTVMMYTISMMLILFCLFIWSRNIFDIGIGQNISLTDPFKSISKLKSFLYNLILFKYCNKFEFISLIIFCICLYGVKLQDAYIFNIQEFVFLLGCYVLYSTIIYGAKRTLLNHFLLQSFGLTATLAFVIFLKSSIATNVILHNSTLANANFTIAIIAYTGIVTTLALPPFSNALVSVFLRLHSFAIIPVVLLYNIIIFSMMYKYLQDSRFIVYIGIFSFCYGVFFAVFSKKLFKTIAYLFLSNLGIIMAGFASQYSLSSLYLMIFLQFNVYAILIFAYSMITRIVGYMWVPKNVYTILKDIPHKVDQRIIAILCVMVLFITPSILYLFPTSSFFTFKEILFNANVNNLIISLCYIMFILKGFAVAKLLYPMTKYLLHYIYNRYIINYEQTQYNSIFVTIQNIKYMPFLLIAVISFAIFIFDCTSGIHYFYIAKIFWLNNIFTNRLPINITFGSVIIFYISYIYTDQNRLYSFNDPTVSLLIKTKNLNTSLGIWLSKHNKFKITSKLIFLYYKFINNLKLLNINRKHQVTGNIDVLIYITLMFILALYMFLKFYFIR